MWVLDGTMQLYPDDLSNVQTGWISEDMSGEDRAYESGVHLTFEFSEPQDSDGLTFVFDQQMPEDIPAEIRVTFIAKPVQSFIQKETHHPVHTTGWMPLCSSTQK